jgi:hypothetical protein
MVDAVVVKNAGVNCQQRYDFNRFLFFSVSLVVVVVVVVHEPCQSSQSFSSK